MTEKGIKLINEFIDILEKESLENTHKLAEEYNIKDLDEDICMELSGVRRPLVLVRGKPITVEQTMRLITGEEPLFGEDVNEKGWLDPREGRGVLKNIFYRQGYDWLSTWVYSDGTIGGDIIHLGKYPELDEILDGYMHLAKKYPFLDMVVSYTTYDECICYGCDIYEGENSLCESSDCKCKDCIPYLDKIKKYSYFNKKWKPSSNFDALYFECWDTNHVRSDVADSVVLTIWIHNGETEVLFGKKASSKFNEYNNLYCAPEYAFMFTQTLYSYDSTCICDKKFVEDCFEFIGKPRSLCDEYVEQKFISPFNEKATVVTKEWVTNQYNTYIAVK